MGNAGSDSIKLKLCLVVIAFAASMLANGCAGVVMGSSASSGGPGTPRPGNTPQPQLAAAPSSASFPNVSVGSSNSQTITLSNGGTGAVTISQIAVSGAGFSQTGLTLPASIAAGQSTTFNVVFAPTLAGNMMGSISLTSDAPNSPLVISANGSTTAATALLVSSTSALDFGSVLAGSNSSLSATLTNAGNANVTISGVSVTGAGYSVSGASNGTTLTPGQTATLNVAFAPTAAGSAIGAITVTSNVAAVGIVLTGSGGQASTHSVALNWDPSTSEVVGYYVYRGLPDGTYEKVNASPVTLTEYSDANIQAGQTYTYVVTAIDADSVESEYSDPVLAVVP